MGGWWVGGWVGGGGGRRGRARGPLHAGDGGGGDVGLADRAEAAAREPAVDARDVERVQARQPPALVAAAQRSEAHVAPAPASGGGVGGVVSGVVGWGDVAEAEGGGLDDAGGDAAGGVGGLLGDGAYGAEVGDSTQICGRCVMHVDRCARSVVEEAPVGGEGKRQLHVQVMAVMGIATVRVSTLTVNRRREPHGL